MTKTLKLARKALSSTALMGVLTFGVPAAAFCGFYVAKGGTDLFNESSKVVLVRDGDRTVITMANDYQGNMTEFAMVIPVPTIITKDQVHISKASILDHIDAYTAPRLVEYFDRDPCEPEIMYDQVVTTGSMRNAAPQMIKKEKESFGVTIEESFFVGEYDILILSAKESGGLQTWLTQNGYKIPGGAGKILESYIKQGMKFFCRQGEFGRKSKNRWRNVAPDCCGVRKPQIHAPHSPRHGKLQRNPRFICLRSHQKWPRRNHQLPHAKNPVLTKKCQFS